MRPYLFDSRSLGSIHAGSPNSLASVRPSDGSHPSVLQAACGELAALDRASAMSALGRRTDPSSLEDPLWVRPEKQRRHKARQPLKQLPHPQDSDASYSKKGSTARLTAGAFIF